MSEPSSWKTFDGYLTAQGDELPLKDSERFVSFSLRDLWPIWQEGARCLGVGTNYYFGDEEQQPTMSIKQVRQASKLCDVCPVYRECLRWALENNEEYGVWAGTSGRTRRKIQKVLSSGSVSVDDVVEDFTHGRRGKYTGPVGSDRTDDLRGGSEYEGASGVRVASWG